MGLAKLVFQIPLAGLIFVGWAAASDEEVCHQGGTCAARALEISADGHVNELRVDDECVDETCSLSALQYRSKESQGTDPGAPMDLTEMSQEMEEPPVPLGAEVEGEEDRRHRHKHYKTKKAKEQAKHMEEMRRSMHRRRISSNKFQATPVYDGPLQPEYCNGTKLRKGHTGCCAGVPFNLRKEGCCGSVRYSTDQLSCCDHHDGTATLFNAYTSNCCDDEFKHNLQGGICDLQFGETSCCVVVMPEAKHRRRRRHTTTTEPDEGDASSPEDGDADATSEEEGPAADKKMPLKDPKAAVVPGMPVTRKFHKTSGEEGGAEEGADDDEEESSAKKTHKKKRRHTKSKATKVDEDDEKKPSSDEDTYEDE